MPPKSEFNSTSFLYKALSRLYYFGQFFGSASFSYSPEAGVHLKPINIFTVVFWFFFYNCLIQTNSNTKLTIHATGFQAVLFYIGASKFFETASTSNWCLGFCLFLFRKRIAKIMEDIMALDSEVSNKEL